MSSNSVTLTVIILVITQIGLPLRGRPGLLIPRMITDQVGFHSVLLPLSDDLYGEGVAIRSSLREARPQGLRIILSRKGKGASA